MTAKDWNKLYDSLFNAIWDMPITDNAEFFVLKAAQKIAHDNWIKELAKESDT